jgi:hypothetical protein
MATMQRTMLRAARRANAEATVDLTQTRAWFDNIQTWGFHQLADVYERRVTELEAERIDDAVFASAEAHTRDMNAILDTFVERTTQRDGAFELPTSGELQPGSENGTPRPTIGYREITQGYPMFRGMDSFGLNREAYAKLTVREMDKLMANVLAKDARWVMRRVFAAIFTNVSWTFKEPGRSDLTVRGLAVSGDGSIYMDYNGDLAAADHYTGQAGAISNSANPFEANSAILRAHPSNTGVIVHYIPSGLMASAMALEGFYPYRPNDGLVQFGGLVDVAADGVGQYLRFGNEVLGVVGDGVIVLSRRLPANYVVSVVDDAAAPLVMRQEPEAELQGLQTVPIQVDSNFRKWDFYRKAGFAVRNPIAIAVREIGDASYGIPANYDLRTLAG